MIPDAAGGMHLWAIATASVVAAACGSWARCSSCAARACSGMRSGTPCSPASRWPCSPEHVREVSPSSGPPSPALVTVGLVQALRTVAGLAEDAGAGVVFTSLFAAGVVIVTLGASRIDLDASCVLYGILEMVPFDTVPVGGVEVPRGLLSSAVVLAVLVAVAVPTWKLQVFSAFDPDGARAAGVPVGAVTTGLLAATAVATVAGFEVVGAVLVVALLVVPAAAAELLVHRLHRVASLAVAFAVGGSIAGYLLAYRWNTSAGGVIAVVLVAEYIAAALLAPEDGCVAQVVGRLRFAWRIAREDRLAAVWRAMEQHGPVAGPRTALEHVAGWWLRLRGRIVGPASLSAAGRREAEMVVRSHRLWEAWLGRHADLPLDHLHPPAEWVEHHLGEAARRRIEAELEFGRGDPHGREIPPEG